MLLIEQSCIYNASSCLSFLCNSIDYNLPAEPAAKTCPMLPYIYLKTSIEEVSNFLGKTNIRYFSLLSLTEICLNFTWIRFI